MEKGSRTAMCRPATMTSKHCSNSLSLLANQTATKRSSSSSQTQSNARRDDSEMKINVKQSGWRSSLRRKSINNSIQQKKREVSFCSLVTVNTIRLKQDNVHNESDSPNSADFEQQRQLLRKTCCKDQKNAKDKSNVPIVNSEGQVCTERRVQQRTAVAAIISYQRRLRERIESSDSSTLRLCPISLKLSQRAKDIALETARQTLLEVYPLLAFESNGKALVPIEISEFPEIKKKKKKRECPGELLGCTPPPMKCSRNEHSRVEDS